MKFYIVTPSYNQLDWLKLCVASVADQAMGGVVPPSGGVPSEHEARRIQVHHHVQDACSSDGTVEWLADYVAQHPPISNYQLTFRSQTDEGMYDAINRGWKLAPDDVDVIAHLNCDEQYLPGALKTTTAFMKIHTKADIVLADLLVVDADGNYVCHRRSLKPYVYLSRFCCPGSTVTTFQRASVTKDKGVFFDTTWRNFGDKVWYNALHKAGCRFEVCNQVVALFTDTGSNLNWTDDGLREKRRYEEEFLNGSGFGASLISRLLGFRRMVKELYMRAPDEYALYRGDASVRSIFPIRNPTGLWHKKWRE